MPIPSEDELRREFHALCAQRAAIETRAKPHRDAYDAKRAEIIALEARELDPLRARMHREEEGLHEIKQQIALISRALGGRTGAPPVGDEA